MDKIFSVSRHEAEHYLSESVERPRKSDSPREAFSEMNSLLRIIVNTQASLEKHLKLNERLDIYRTAKLRRYLRSSHPGLQVQHPVRIEHPECVEIGRDVSIAAFVHIWGGGGVHIGDRVLIGSHCAITSETHDHRVAGMNASHVAKPVVIEDDVWLGAHAVILPGITIGRGAVIGAGAVVTKNIEPMSIVGGVPAKPIGKRQADPSLSLS
jgi:maltose O-acetyltransferase